MNDILIDKLVEWRDYSGSSADLFNIFDDYYIISKLDYNIIIDNLHGSYNNHCIRKQMQNLINE